MSEQLSSEDRALVRAAGLVREARGDLTGDLAQLRSTLQGIGGQWQGTGARAFSTVMTRWEDQQRRVVGALDEFEERLRLTDTDLTGTDDAAGTHFDRYARALG